MLRIRDTGAMSQCRNFHLYRNEQGKQGVIDGRRNVFVPARYDTLIMRDTIWANWFGEFEKHAGLYVHIDGLTPTGSGVSSRPTARRLFPQSTTRYGPVKSPSDTSCGGTGNTA